jgi:homoserine dehydrogenase
VVTAVDIRPEARKEAGSLKGTKIAGFEVPEELAIGEGGYAKALPAEWLKPLELRDVAVTSMVPPELTDLSLADFLVRLPEVDADFADRVAHAAAAGCTLRYIAELRDGRATVGLQPVPSDSALGRLQGNDNLVAFHTRYYSDAPLVLQGRGAGVDAAAAGVHADIVALANPGS